MIHILYSQIEFMLERGKQLLRTILFKTMDCYAQQINKDTDRLKKN
jgi:hypothetical protein